MTKNFIQIISSCKLQSFLMSFCAALAFPYVLKIEPMQINNSIVLFVLWWCFFNVIYNMLKNSIKKNIFFSLIMGFIYSLLLVLGRNFELYGNIDLSFMGFLKLLFIISGFSFVLAAFISMLCRMFVDEKLLEKGDRLKLKNIRYDQYYYIKLFIIMMISWIAFWTIFWPGIFSYDVPSQLTEAVTGNYTNWHPIIHTLFLYKCMIIGKDFLHSCDMGCAIYVLIQLLIMASICAYTMKILAKNKFSWLIRAFAFCSFVISPIHLFFVISTTKDVLFAGSILLFVTLLIDFVCNQETFFNSIRNNILLFISVSGALVFRTNGIFIYIIALPFLLIALKSVSAKIKMFLISAIPVGIYLWFVFYGFAMLNIGPTRPEEVISVPMQQIARTILYHKDELPQEDVDAFYEVFADDVLDRYCHFNVDYLKFNTYRNWQDRLFNTEMYLKNKDKYKKIWLKTACSYPGEYLKAFLCLNSPFWNPDYKYTSQKNSLNYFICYINVPLAVYDFYVTPRPQWLNDYLWYHLECNSFPEPEKPFYNKSFITAIFFSTGFPLWILLFSTGFVIFRRRQILVLPLIVPLVTSFVYLFSPLYLLRYNYAVILCIPLMLAVIALAAQENKEN